MTGRYWWTVAAYVLPTFPLGYFWHLSIFERQYAELGLYRPDVIIPFGLAAMILQGCIFAYLVPRIVDPGPAAWRANAARLFVVFGTLAWSFAVLTVAAKYNMTSVPRFVALESAFTALQFVVVSPLMVLAATAFWPSISESRR